MDFVQFLLGVVLSGLASVVPAILYSLLLWWADRYKREPLALVVAAFLWGAGPAAVLAVVGEAILDLPLAGLGLAGEIASASGAAPLVEETVKALALVALFLFSYREFDDVLDGIVYGGLVGFGFAMTENFLYFLGAFLSGGVGQWVLSVVVRGAVFGLNHAFYTAFTGAGLGLARRWGLRGRGLVAAALGYALALAFHALHNLGSTLASTAPPALFLSVVSDVGGILVVLTILALSLQRERQWIAEELRPEIGEVLTEEEYACLLSPGRAAARRCWPLGRRRADLLTELAFRKAQARETGRDPARDPAVLALRQRVASQPPPSAT
ncbi:MAG: PrsW family intramembrane metalloprotease [Anaerolineae bacterium]